jgi:Tfp pilus assembly protein PilX
MRDCPFHAVHPPRGDRGFALIAVIVVMTVLGLIGSAALTLTAGDQKVTRLFADANQADGAATAGLEHAVAVFQTNGAFPFTATINGYSYTVDKTADVYDINGDTAADTVYLASDGTLNETGDGHVVWVLTSTATKGSFKAEQEMRVAKRTLTVGAPGALTASSSITLSGNITVDGRNHNATGSTVLDPNSTANTGACSDNKAAVTLADSTESVTAQGSVAMDGNDTYASSSPPYVADVDSIDFTTPEDVLGLNPGDLDGLIQQADSYVSPVDSIIGLVYVDGDYGSGEAGGSELNGTGILIVHNPLYNPLEHDPTSPYYDAAKVSDSRYAPANLGNINGGSFHGLVIADKIDRINGNIDITGAVISLSEIDVTLVGNGTAEIKYSCSALQQAGSASSIPPARLSWSAD